MLDKINKIVEHLHNDLNDCTKCTLSKCVDDTKLKGVFDTPNGCAAN